MKKFLAIFAVLGLILCQTAVFAQLDYEGVLLISEVGYDTLGDDSQEEWFEIVNSSELALSLDDIRVGDEEKSGGNEGMLRFPEGMIIQPQQAIIIAQTAAGFRAIYGFNPNFEVMESDTAVPNMRRSLLWSTGELALGNDGDELLLLQGPKIIDAINYEDRTTFFAPAISEAFRGQSIERHPANCDTNSAADWQTAVSPTPGFVVFETTCQAPINPALLERLPTISEIQGDGERSPLENQIVTFRGVVTGFHADTNASGITFYTLFVQDLVGFEDGDANTSDGLAIFLGRQAPIYQLGDQLRISGQVTEFFGLTEIDDQNLQMWLEASDQSLPEPIEIGSLMTESLEPLEGMRVRISEGSIAAPHFRGCGFFVHLTESEKLFERGDEDGVVLRPFPILNHQEESCAPLPPLKFGDDVQAVVGPLTHHFNQFKIVIQADHYPDVEIHPLPTINPVRQMNQGEITVATFNLLNHFDHVDDTGTSAEPVISMAEIDIRERKIGYAIAHWLNCPTVIAIQEVENEALLLRLAEKLAPDCRFLYAVAHEESADSRGIDVAFMVNPNQVEIVSEQLLRICWPVMTEVADPLLECSENQYPLFSRPPLVIETTIDDVTYLFVSNHFKSKRGGEAETAVQRRAQAGFLNQWVGEQLAQNPDANIVVMGDFNDFERSGTMASLMANEFLTNALLTIPNEERYSLSFGGVYQLIDGILLSPNLVETVVEAQILHVNADFPFQFETAVSDEQLPFRSSDHDLPIVWLKRIENAPEPTAVPTEIVRVETAVAPQPSPVPIAPSQPEEPALWPYVLPAFGGVLFAILGFAIYRRINQTN
ncbi:MAG: lamin tail domain-containing protein [Chloroflexota bacterium]